MFARAASVFTFLFFVLPLLAAAGNPAPTPTPISTAQCNTGNLQCCNSVQSSDSNAVSNLLGLLGVALGGAAVLAGVTCTPITVVGAGGNSCSAQPVCCTNNSFNGAVALGCTPVNLNL